MQALAAAAQSHLGGAALHPALTGLFGRRIGLSLNEGGEIGAGSAGLVQANTVYSLQAGVLDEAQGGAIASALVLTKAQGARWVRNRDCPVMTEPLGPSGGFHSRCAAPRPAPPN